MTVLKTSLNRRAFLRASTLAGGGMLLSFDWFAHAGPGQGPQAVDADSWHEFNAFLKIRSDGAVTIVSPNPEFGQNVKTSMPMIVAEELDVDWQSVIVEQGAFNTDLYTRQFAGGSQSIRQGWAGLRMAGATARHMLREAAAQAWGVPVQAISTRAGRLYHEAGNRSASYGELASVAAGMAVPDEVSLKSVDDFTIVGTSRRNVEGENIVTGKPMFGLDFQREGMLIAMIVHPPAFGMTFRSVDDRAARAMPGIRDVFPIETFPRDFEHNLFSDNAFPQVVAIVGNSTWEVMNAKQALRVEWQPIQTHAQRWVGGREVEVPAGLENTAEHYANMAARAGKGANELRRDGDPEAAFRNAARVIERTYTAPFLAHNAMEPMNFFADVTADSAYVAGPLQAPEFIEPVLSARLDIPLDKIEIEMTRMGGGFGRRAYCHYVVEAALISRQAKAPVKLVYSREDDMTNGIYRPTYHATYRAALDAENRMTGFHVRAGGIPESPFERGTFNRFPAGAVDNYLAEDWSIASNITVGAFRAPRSNFIACAEQSFLDEVAEAAGRDPIDFRLELLQRARRDPVGKDNDYDAGRYAGVLELVREKSAWGSDENRDASRGVAVYFCHNSYAAHVVDLSVEKGRPMVHKVHSAVDCGIVVNPDAAANMVEGAVVDGIGNALYGAMTFTDGKPDQNNFDRYRVIRYSEAPGEIAVHFVDNAIDPTGLGEPPFPPVMAALANALYRATGKRFYNQPFIDDIPA